MKGTSTPTQFSPSAALMNVISRSVRVLTIRTGESLDLGHWAFAILVESLQEHLVLRVGLQPSQHHFEITVVVPFDLRPIVARHFGLHLILGPQTAILVLSHSKT